MTDARIDTALSDGLQGGAWVKDRYQLATRIGVGGMGQVWKARDVNTGQDVAIKFLADHVQVNGTDAEELRRRFDREIETLAQLKSAGIVRMTDRGVYANDQMFLVMEYLEGESLRELLLKRKYLEYAEVLDILEEIGLALREPHAIGIVHRDITPGNIFVQRLHGGHISYRLLDFGIAKLVTTQSHFSGTQLAGTIKYMAPEQFRGKVTPSPAVDLYSLGVVAWECLAGRALFDGSYHQVLFDHINTPPSSFPKERNVPPQLVQFVRSLLSKEPESRIPDIKVNLGRVLAGTNKPDADALVNRVKALKTEIQFSVDATVPGPTKLIFIWMVSYLGYLKPLLFALFAFVFFVVFWMWASPTEKDSRRPAALTITPLDLIKVPDRGKFIVGCRTKSGCGDDELQQQKAKLAAFEIERSEVSVAAYEECVQRKICTPTGDEFYCNFGKKGGQNAPVNCVTYSQAEVYCHWKGLSLPTELQWERAARGTQGSIYPWGNSLSDDSLDVTPDGVRSMATGLWEWTSTDMADMPKKIIKGGVWSQDDKPVKTSVRSFHSPDNRSPRIGFRCIRTNSNSG